ncbi:MAG: sugar ABC transporter ATP-binding protein [Mycobacteriales bacterium]
MPAPAVTSTVLRVSNLSKAYSGTLALDDVDLDVRPGEVHALLGGNGSGKSTLIKVLAGVVQAEAGGLLELGDKVQDLSGWSGEKAYAAGLRFVHQQPAVFADLSIAENIAFGSTFPKGRGGKIDWKALNARTAQLLTTYGVDALPTTPLGDLRAADRTRIAIIRAVQDRDDATSGVLVLDEPTAALPTEEVEHLLDSLRRYAAAGQTILYVSHRLDEVLSVADRVTVLRDGKKVDTVSAKGLSEAALVELIVGRPLDRMFPDPTDAPEHDVILSARGLRGGPLQDVSFDLHQGEVLGIAGLLGSGRSELLRMVFGAYPVDGGTLTLGGREVRFRTPSEAMRAGVAYVPEERQLDALFQGNSVRHNISAGDARGYFSRLRFRHSAEKRDAASAIRDFLIRVGADTQPVETLSGGNAQKVVLARWLRRRPAVLLLDEPTQGVDIGARAEIYGLVREATRNGTSVLLVASDPEELAHACDRVLVLRGGQITADVRPPVGADRLTALLAERS